MASLMEDLLEVLDRENEEYGRLVTLAQEKREVIIHADIGKLQEITEQEQLVTDLLHNLERRRRGVLSDMAVVLGKNPEELNVERMISILERQPKEQKKLMECRTRLRATLDEMLDWNRRNQTLLQQALEMVEFDLTLYKSLRQMPETANYDSSAANTGTLLTGGGFDAKQ